MQLGIFSAGIARIPYLRELLGGDIFRLHRWSKSKYITHIAGWGLRTSTQRARLYARCHHIPYVALEDGFLRSFGTGDNFPPLSVVVDELGIYYDCNHPSALEQLLVSDADVLGGDLSAVKQLRFQLLHARLSKYNHAPEIITDRLRSDDVQRILVVDQTVGDMSVELGAANSETFVSMLNAALHENPKATIYIKTHPEVTTGRKGGYLTEVQPSARVVVLRDAANPLSLIQKMDKVYVVSSTMGFEALLAGKSVICFGLPWYAGWGITDDRQPTHPAMLRRAQCARQRNTDELFAAAYIHYTRYLDPEKFRLGDIKGVITWLKRQRAMAERYSGRMIVVGFRRWKAANVQAMLSLKPGNVIFKKNAQAAAVLKPSADDCLIFWGSVPPSGLENLASQSGAKLLRMEDGFVRSLGLGSDLIPPQSFVLDANGIYFDPSKPSDLEYMLNTRAITDDDIIRAQAVRTFIVQHGITKYNLEPLQPVDWSTARKLVVLVPGQVEDDASIRFGCDPKGVCTNMGLLQAARTQYPEAFIVYKPHPDVSCGNRRGKIPISDALQLANHVEQQASVISCIEASDVVVTMTSLTGFDALLRAKQVVVHGRPFYAGWGLTQDKLSIPRRNKVRNLDELVACALLHYPLYWDPVLKGYTTCEAILSQLLQCRDDLKNSGLLRYLKVGYMHRQWRKLQIILRSLRRI